MDKEIDFDTAGVYRIQLKEDLGPNWNEWFSGFALTREAGGGCILSGRVEDQAMLHGLIRSVRDLGLTLVSIQIMEGPEPNRERGK